MNLWILNRLKNLRRNLAGWNMLRMRRSRGDDRHGVSKNHPAPQRSEVCTPLELELALFPSCLSPLNKCGYEATKQRIFHKNLPLQLSEPTSFRASSYHQEFALALAAHLVWKEKVMNFSHRSSRATWYERGTSTSPLTSPFLT